MAGEVQILLDCSDFQGEIPFEKLPPEIVGVILKASDGARGRQKHFARNWKEAKAHGKLRGAYEWYQPRQSIDDQVKNHTDAVMEQGYEDTDFAPSSDFEDSDNGAVTGDALLGGFTDYHLAIEEAFGRPGQGIVYSGTWFWNLFVVDAQKKPLDSPILASRPYWHSAYPSLGTAAYAYREAAMKAAKLTQIIAYPWQMRGLREAIHQFDGDGGLRLPNGVDTDVNIFHGSMEDLKNFIARCSKVRATDPGTGEDDWRIGTQATIDALRARIAQN